MAPFPPWKDLPQELISIISSFLSSNPLDILNLRSACKSFHSCIPYPSHLLSPFCPLPLPSPPPSLSWSFSRATSSLILTATAIYSISPRAPIAWVVFFDELNHGTLSIRRPFSKRYFVPPLDFPTKLSLSDFKFEQLGTFYNVTYADFVCGKFFKTGLWNWSFNKVVVFGNGVGLVLLSKDGKLGFLRFGDGCQWRVLHYGNGFTFDDVIEFKGRVLGIDRRARVYEIVMAGCDDMSIELNVVAPPISCGGGRRKRLIESLGCLYLVVRMNKKNEDMSEFRVYVMNEKIMKWVVVNGIGDRVFLFGIDFSVACDAHKFEGLVDGNYMVFYDHSFAGYKDLKASHFHYTSSKFSDLPVSINRFEACAKIQAVKSLPSYSSLIWPPPIWIWPNIKSKRSGTFVAATNRLLKRISDDELKANYQELSSKLRPLVAGDGISQQKLHEMLNNIDMLLKFLNDIVEEIEKDTKIIMRSIREDEEARHEQNIVMNNQVNLFKIKVGTLRFSDEDKNGSSEDEWVSNEISQRLSTHVWLKRVFNRQIETIVRNRDKFEAIVAKETRVIVNSTD